MRKEALFEFGESWNLDVVPAVAREHSFRVDSKNARKSTRIIWTR